MTEYQIPPIPYLRLRATLTAHTQARLPPFKGSLLRGAFGHALRRTVCTMGPQQPCASCPRRPDCVYPHLFECLIEERTPPFIGGLPAAPRPFVFEPRSDACDYRPGDELGFDLLLLGRGVELQAFAVQAIERMAATGLGARRAPFRLATVDYRSPDGTWGRGYRQREGRWNGPAAPSLPPDGGTVLGERRTLRFLTPTRIKVKGRLAIRLSFPTLALRMLRRTLELAHFHVPGAAIDWQTEPFLERAEEVRIADSRLEWRDWQRYSNRQGRKMKLGGFVGELDLEGDLAPFDALLRTAEVIHLGKGTTFGLGKVEVAGQAAP